MFVATMILRYFDGAKILLLQIRRQLRVDGQDRERRHVLPELLETVPEPAVSFSFFVILLRRHQ